MAARVRSATTVGLDARMVDVETDVSLGLPAMFIVGLPDPAVQESKERVRAGLKNSGAYFPRHRITVNLAPADLRKEGPSFDLPIALSILVATHQLPPLPNDHLVIGELSLDGQLRPVTGVLPIAFAAQLSGAQTMIVPAANAQEAALVHNLNVKSANTLAEIIDFFRGQATLPTVTADVPTPTWPEPLVDLSEIIGQEQAKRALEIAAAGGHNLLLSGPPGSGKTMLAKALHALLPPMNFEEALEVTQIYSVAGHLGTQTGLLQSRPFRHPHHSASAASIVGGGRLPRPGEISLAHRGVLFFDEFPEFPRSVLESLREPLEEGTIVVSRIAGNARFPADFLFVAAMNPCPCGNLTDQERQCRCTPQQIFKYERRLSGPLLDRIDLHVHVPRLPFQKMLTASRTTLRVLQERVAQARQRQQQRETGRLGALNRHLTPQRLRECVVLDSQSRRLLKQAVHELRLSIRSYHRVLKVARTIADLARSEGVRTEHVAEALQYRSRVD